ncbi:hypothetical protein ACJIZ3_001690 [Penstemon smallii]|uniref:F-box/LRR-repeat protein 15-like leucin rich repeat domain-containing protein n=1 Tax=Penstemon smallii TaxID=265156 RepID=A0ABD3U5D5_9LAMI
MKRLNEKTERGTEYLGFNGIGVSGALEMIEGEEEIVYTENRVEDSAQLDNNGEFLENTVVDNFEGLSLGGVKEDNKLDLDLNFDNGEEQRSAVLDHNVPAFGTEDDGNGKEPLINEERVEIVEVEYTGRNISYAEKGKQIELRLGIDNMDLDSGGERRYTSEEEEDADAEATALGVLLSLKYDDWPVDVDCRSNREDPVEIAENSDSDEVEPLQPEALPIPLQPAALPARLYLEGGDIEERRQRERMYLEEKRQREKMYRLKIAKRLACPIENDGLDSKIESSCQKQLGNCPGPFSEALRRVRERTSKKTAEQLIEWKHSIENRDHSIFVPSLFELSLKAFAENAERIDSLELIPDNLRRRLADLLCDMRKMNARLLNLFVSGYPHEIRIKDCSWLTEEEFQHTFGSCHIKDLRVLQLDLCGQCMYNISLKNTLARPRNSLSSLVIVSLRGALRLSDSGIRKLVISAPKLQSVNLGQCALLTSQAIDYIADYSVGSNLRELYIDDCQKIDAMLILPAIKKLTKLEVLSVAGMETVTDQFIVEMITDCGQNMKELDLANCVELTDYALEIIGSKCAGLCSLNISNLHKLTDLGLEFLADGCRSIQKLKLTRNAFRFLHDFNGYSASLL